MIDIDVVGLPALLAGLHAKGTEIQLLGTDEAMRAAAEPIRDAWVANIESEGLVDTGAYRDSIGIVEEAGFVAVTTDVPYAGFLEYGTAFVAPHPVAERALDENDGAAIDAAAASLGGRL